ncbi:MAG: ABC transporter permease [Pseudomonadota bacterium]
MTATDTTRRLEISSIKSFGEYAWKRLSARPRLTVGCILVAFVVFMGIFAPWIAPNDPSESSINVLIGPTHANWFGTDDLGRDVFSRVIYGARTSLIIGIGGAVVAVLVGAPIGLLAGYLGGVVDLILVPVIDLFLAMPALVLALIIITMVGASFGNIVLVLGFVMWPIIARLVRGQALTVKTQPFVDAAKVAGAGPIWIMRKHVWPNLMRVIAAQFAIIVSFCIFTSASLSFLGLGVPPPTPDWGGMVRTGSDFLSINPLMSLAPGLAVAVTAVGFYLMGSAVE